MFLRRLGYPFYQFLVPATLALPQRIDGVRLSGVLINRTIRRNDFAATDRARAAAGGALLDVNILQLALVVQLVPSDWSSAVLSAGFALTNSKNKDCAKH